MSETDDIEAEWDAFVAEQIKARTTRVALIPEDKHNKVVLELTEARALVRDLVEALVLIRDGDDPDYPGACICLERSEIARAALTRAQQAGYANGADEQAATPSSPPTRSTE